MVLVLGGAAICINSQLLIAINWQNWVKLPPASLLWLLHRERPPRLPNYIVVQRCGRYSQHCTFDFIVAVLAQCDEAGIRQIASWETAGRPAKAPWEHLGPWRNVPTAPGPQIQF